MLASLKKLFFPSAELEQAYNAYVRIVSQARQPVFYKEWKVEDTVDGRFDVIILHLVLVLMRCEDDLHLPEVQLFSRHLSEAFFSDMDRSLREMGASDTGVGIRVKKMAEAFYGRQKAYRETMGDETALAEVLRRNVYREKPVANDTLASLAAYMGRNRKALQLRSVDAIMQGGIVFSN